MLGALEMNSNELTVGNLCLAIGDGRVNAKLENEYYTVTRKEIARYLTDQVLAEFTPKGDRKPK